MPDENSNQRQHGNQLAQENVRERLSALYAQRGKLDIKEEEGMYQVTLQFPYEQTKQPGKLLRCGFIVNVAQC